MRKRDKAEQLKLIRVGEQCGGGGETGKDILGI